MNACGDSRLRGLRSRKPIGFRQWVVHHIDLDWGVMDISFRLERTGTGTVRHHHGADENCRGRN